MKNKKAGAIPNNYRPITCLCTAFKLMTAIIADAIQNHLCKYNLIPEKQKGNRRNSRGTKDQLLIDKMILRNSVRLICMSHGLTTRRHSIHYHSWIAKCLEIVRISGNIRQFLRVAMASWKTVLTVLDYIHIRRGIFQGDSLSPLLYIIAMIPMTTILRQTGLGYQTSKSAAKISHLRRSRK